MDLKFVAMFLLVGTAVLAVSGTAAGIYSFGGIADGTSQNETAGIANGSVPGVNYYYTTVTMSGFASESVVPDTASFTVTIKTFDENSKANSSKKNAEVVKKVKDALVANGVEKNDMATESYYVYEKYNSTYEYGYYDGQVLTGYETTHQILVKTDKLDSLGKFFDAALQSGASDVGDVRWSLKEETVLALQKKLSKEALENVNDKVVYAFPDAEMYDLNSVNESHGYNSWSYYPGYTYGASWYGFAFTEGSEMTEVEIPEVEIRVNIDAQYIVRDFDAPVNW